MFQYIQSFFSPIHLPMEHWNKAGQHRYDDPGCPYFYNSQDPLNLVSSHFPRLPPLTLGCQLPSPILLGNCPLCKSVCSIKNIWTIVSSKNRLKKSSGVEVVVNVILGPGCWTNGSGVGGVSRCCQCSWCSTDGIQLHLPFPSMTLTTC